MWKIDGTTFTMKTRDDVIEMDNDLIDSKIIKINENRLIMANNKFTCICTIDEENITFGTKIQVFNTISDLALLNNKKVSFIGKDDNNKIVYTLGVIKDTDIQFLGKIVDLSEIYSSNSLTRYILDINENTIFIFNNTTVGLG